MTKLFKAEDFGFLKLILNGGPNQCADVANARLAPLVAALEVFERSRVASADIRAWDEFGNAVLAEYRKLRGDKP